MGEKKRDICDYKTWRRITTFRELRATIRAVLIGQGGSAVIQAGSGLGKSESVREEVEKAVAQGYPMPLRWGSGSASAFGMYCEVAEFPDHPIIADDFDFPLMEDSEVRALIRALTDTPDAPARVTWIKKTPEGVPQSVLTRSSLLLVVNELNFKKHGMKAILNRAANRVRFAPPPHELQKKAAGWASIQEVFDFWSRALPFMSNPNQRCLRNAETIHGSSSGVLDWRDSIADDADYIACEQVEVFKAWVSAAYPTKADLYRSLGEGARSRPTIYRWLKDWDAEIKGQVLTGLRVQGVAQGKSLRLVATSKCSATAKTGASAVQGAV